MTTDDIQRADADRTGRAQNGEVLHCRLRDH
jgi:hypothetical protein